MECIKCKKSIPEDALFCPYCGKKQAAARKKKKKRANGMGTVIKKAGGRSKPWEAQKGGVYIGCYETKFEAEQALAALVDVRMSETFNMTFQQVYEKWKPEHERTVTDKGMEGYRIAYGHCSTLYNRVFRKLRASDFQSVIIDMEQNNFSKSSCEKVMQLFGQLSKWAIREEICHTNYAQFVTVTAQQKSAKAPFTSEQIKSIQKSISPAADIALVLLATGCRPNELFIATIENCYDDYFISGSKTKAGRNRVIPVGEIGKRSYNKLIESAKLNKGILLIDGYSGNKIYKNFAKRDWKDLMTECGIQNMTPYACRHTYTTLAVQSGVRPEILQKILGHADYSTTIDVYTHLGVSDILEEIKKITVADTLQTQEEEPK